jgi:hypothetical protein
MAALPRSFFNPQLPALDESSCSDTFILMRIARFWQDDSEKIFIVARNNLKFQLDYPPDPTHRGNWRDAFFMQRLPRGCYHDERRNSANGQTRVNWYDSCNEKYRMPIVWKIVALFSFPGSDTQSARVWLETL